MIHQKLTVHVSCSNGQPASSEITQDCVKANLLSPPPLRQKFQPAERSKLHTSVLIDTSLLEALLFHFKTFLVLFQI